MMPSKLQTTKYPPHPPAFCPVAPGALVAIYELVAENTWPAWLCPAGARAVGSQKWRGFYFTVRSRRTPPHGELRCDFHGADGCAR